MRILSRNRATSYINYLFNVRRRKAQEVNMTKDRTINCFCVRNWYWLEFSALRITNVVFSRLSGGGNPSSSTWNMWSSPYTPSTRMKQLSVKRPTVLFYRQSAYVSHWTYGSSILAYQLTHPDRSNSTWASLSSKNILPSSICVNIPNSKNCSLSCPISDLMGVIFRNRSF